MVAGPKDKNQIRQSHRQIRRQGLPRDDGPPLAQHLHRLLIFHGVGPGTVLAGFLPAPGEPDVRPAMTQAWLRGDQVVVPRTLPGSRMEWVRWSPGSALQPDRHGLQAPAGNRSSGDMWGVMLIPALAVDQRGTRVGHGAGYYDRALALLPRWPTGPLRVAVVHPHEVVRDGLPKEPHDQAVDAVLTRDGWWDVGAAD